MTEGSNLFISPKTSSNTAYTLRVNALVIRDIAPFGRNFEYVENFIHYGAKEVKDA